MTAKLPPPGFERDIRPLFRARDVDAMARRFDLSAYDDVRANAGAIRSALSSGTMPCDGAWPVAKIDLFQAWIDAGFPG